MKILKRILSREEGTAAIELSIGLPLLITFIYGIFQVGVALQAIAGIQHGLGEGARMGSVCLTPNPVTGCGTATEAQIRERIRSKVFGVRVGTFSEPVVVAPATTVCAKCFDASVTFTMPMDFLLFNGPTISITRSKRIYLA